MRRAAIADEVDAALRVALSGMGDAGRVVVAFSGGADSTALLAAAAGARRTWLDLPVYAFHFDHRLHSDSPAWATHCRDVCAHLGIPLLTACAYESPPRGASIEAWARDARYGAFTRELCAGDALLTAHHRDDLAETLLLMAMRGSGPHGLAAIAPSRPLGAGVLLRPLLDIPREQLRARLALEDLPWLQDPANADPRYDRNFIRQEVLPLLARRWPAAAANLARAAGLQRTAAAVLDEYADDMLGSACEHRDTLDTGRLAGLAPARQRLILRRWLRLAGGGSPDADTLSHVLREVVSSRHDATPIVAWRGGEIRRHAGKLHWLPAPPPAPLAGIREWSPANSLELPGGVLSATAVVGEGLRASALAGRLLRVRVRQGGERIRPRHREHGMPVKHLLQDLGVPTWERGLLPLVYLEDRLVAVADLAVEDEFAAGAGEAGLRLAWSRLPAAQGA
jgi:tRNA(Ile)-lysidine synthase